MQQTIIRNMICCNFCGEEIESKTAHDYRRCRCGRVAVDGGHEYLRRCYHEKSDYTELSEIKQESEGESL